MGHRTEKEIVPRSFKYPMFFLGLLIMIVGGLGAVKLDLSIQLEALIVAVGFLVLLLGIVLE